MNSSPESTVWLTAAFLLLLARLGSAQNYGDLRLLQGDRTDSSFSAGRLEIFINSTWGSICADNFNMTDANVACRQLGYQGAVSTDTSFHTPYGKGRDDGPVWLDEVNCKDDLLHLLSCANDGVGKHDCDHFSDVAVVCVNELRPASPQPMDVRLRGGQFKSEGRVELYCGGRWSAVCDQLDFQQSEADAVCRELGYTEAADFDADVSVEDLQVPKWLGQLSCANETDGIASCGECADTSDDDSLPGCLAVTVQCTHTVPYGSLRLVQDLDVDADFTHGRLEIFQDGQWGTVCSDSFSHVAADISCRQLGFLRALRFQDSQDVGFGVGSDSDQTGFQCTEDEERLIQCPKVMSWEDCTHDRDVAVFCTNSHPIMPAPGTPPPENRKTLPTSTLIGILVGCFLALVLLCVGFGVISAHFCFVPYSVKKERHNLYFVEREASAEAEAETSLNRNLESGTLDDLGKPLGIDLLSQSRQKHSNRYVSLDMSSPTTTADSPPLQQMAEPAAQEVNSAVPQPVQSSAMSMPSPGHVSVHSLHVLPGSPQKKHSISSPLTSSKGSLNSTGSFTFMLSQIQASPSSSQPISPIPTSIPIPPPLKRQSEQNRAASNDVSSNHITAEDKARIKRGLVNSSYMSESAPTLAQGMFQSHNPFPPSDHGSLHSIQQESPLATTVQTKDSQHGTPTRGIMKSPKSANRNTSNSTPHLDNLGSKADIVAGDNTSCKGRVCDQMQPNVATDDDQHMNNHRVSFMLD